jgi:purine-binding chemotaxis protein CheW
MRELFNLPKKDSDTSLSILIVKNQEMELGLVAESVLGERKIPQNKMRSQMPTFDSAYDRYIKGVTNDRVIVLNMDTFLSDSNIVVHQEVGD